MMPDGLLDKIASTLADIGGELRYFSKGLWVYTRRGLHYETVRNDDEWKRRRYTVGFQTNSNPMPRLNREDEPSFDSIMDGCLVGYNRETAFIFWVEEDD